MGGILVVLWSRWVVVFGCWRVLVKGNGVRVQQSLFDAETRAKRILYTRALFGTLLSLQLISRTLFLFVSGG